MVYRVYCKFSRCLDPQYSFLCVGCWFRVWSIHVLKEVTQPGSRHCGLECEGLGLRRLAFRGRR